MVSPSGRAIHNLRAWQVTDGLSSSPFSSDYFWTPPLDLATRERSKEPFVIPTLNIFLKTRFRPDFADTNRPRARTEMKLREEELFVKSEKWRSRSQQLQKIPTPTKCRDPNDSSRLDYDSICDKLAAVVYMKMSEAMLHKNRSVWFIIL